jgi:dCTP deaminase
VKVADERPFIVHPGEFVLGVTKEHVELPDNLAARMEGRSSLGRLGIIVHSTAGKIDPGWKGKLTLEITNIGKLPVALYPGMRFCCLVFEPTSSPVEKPYSKFGKYAGMDKPGTSKISEEFKK